MIKFQFDSFSAFMHMAGHGPYVWAAYAITVAGIGLCIYQARLKKKAVIKKIRLAHLRSNAGEGR